MQRNNHHCSSQFLWDPALNDNVFNLKMSFVVSFYKARYALWAILLGHSYRTFLFYFS